MVQEDPRDRELLERIISSRHWSYDRTFVIYKHSIRESLRGKLNVNRGIGSEVSVPSCQFILTKIIYTHRG